MTSVPARAFRYWDVEDKGCKLLRSATIPSSVKVIKVGAFAKCPSLTSVTMPSSVEEIESCAFQLCPLLTSVTVPSTASVDSYAFLRSPTTVTKRTPEEMAAA